MLKGGVIMDVVTPEQAKIAEDAGAVAVMALERVPADIRAQGGVARMSDPDMIESIIGAVSVPVMAKCRIGHFAEAQVLQAIGVDYIDESEVPMRRITWISGRSRCRSCAGRRAWARRCGGSPRARR
jgi:pyridoxal 5'-phosphate synthase pdxS subunit